MDLIFVEQLVTTLSKKLVKDGITKARANEISNKLKRGLLQGVAYQQMVSELGQEIREAKIESELDSVKTNLEVRGISPMTLEERLAQYRRLGLSNGKLYPSDLSQLRQVLRYDQSQEWENALTKEKSLERERVSPLARALKQKGLV
jgi:hypothetical protein